MAVLGRTHEDLEVSEARSLVMERGPVPAILAKQHPDGYREGREDFYVRTKYRDTVWTLLLLAELLPEFHQKIGSEYRQELRAECHRDARSEPPAGMRDERIEKACELLIRLSQDRESGGFANRCSRAVLPSRAKSGGARLPDSLEGGDPACVLPCLTGNMVFALIRFGLLEDERVQHGIAWITRCQRFENGDGGPPKGFLYERFEKCWGKHTCYYGVVKALKALCEIPAEKRTVAVKTTIERCVEYILKHRIYKRSHDPSRVGNEDWTRFGFPLMWNTDLLEILLLLTGLGIREERMKDAIDLLLVKRREDGRWPLEKSFAGRFQIPVERVGKPSTWVTLRAMIALKTYRGL